jgi:enoyl reductase-like protein
VKDTGGVITVRSELGEPIHNANNRALKLWKGYDDSVSSLLARSVELAPGLRANVIERLNAPWFPAKKDGHVTEDLGDVTYEEVVLRLL